MNRSLAVTAAVYLAVFVLVAAPSSRTSASGPPGQHIFRYDTFGDEQLWTDTLQMQKALQNVTHPQQKLDLAEFLKSL
ncbi:MAG TPA: hypothetical protein VFV78_04520 [Vicinamibacterales bacterium]|nr:hypothetical protein [Vicinamibacterales bacterium]